MYIFINFGHLFFSFSYRKCFRGQNSPWLIYISLYTSPHAKHSRKPQHLRKTFRKTFWKVSSRRTSLALACCGDGAAQSTHARAVASPASGADGMDDMSYMKT